LDKHTDINNPHMNLIIGEMLYAAMHSGRHHSLQLLAPSMHCSIKHVTIVEIDMPIHDVCLFKKKFNDFLSKTVCKVYKKSEC